MKFRIRGYGTTRAQRGWICDTCFVVETADQFTWEEHVARGSGRWLLTAMIDGYRMAKRKAAVLAAKPGEREAKGWA